MPNIPANGWWHEWTYNYNVKVDNNEVHLDIAEREAKILVYLGDNWQPPAPEPQPVVESSPAPESEPQPAVESSPADQSNGASQEQKQNSDPSTNQNPQSTPSETPPQ